jgi:ABC-type Fe3+-hydroxamate transport system substrate-binding protein
MLRSVCVGILTRGSSPVPEPSHPNRTVASSGSPHTVARPCRRHTGFPRKPRGQSWTALRVFLCFLVCAAAVSAPPQPAESARPRVVALIPSIAEDLYAVGAGPQVVAVSAFTDLPQARNLPRVGDANGIDAERIVALRPDLVIGIPSQTRQVEPLRRAGLRVVLLPDDTYDEIFKNLRAIGELTGHRTEATATIGRLQRETAQLQARTHRFARRPSLFVVLGSGPIWTAGSTSYISTLIDLAGGVNAAGDLHAAYSEYSAEALLRAAPDMLISDPAVHLDAVLDREPWRSLRAVTLHRVYSMDPRLVLQPGPNYNQGLRWLIGRLTPLATAH